MTRAFAVRLSLSAMIAACIAIALLHAQGSWSAASLPLYAQQQSNGQYVLRGFPDVPFPATLAEGDVLAPQAMTAVERAAVLYGVGVPSGSTIGVTVLRGGRILRASIPAQPASAFAHDWLRRLVTAFLITPFLAALALLTLWRGRDRVAAGLCGISLYALAAKALMALASMLVAPLVAAWLIWIVVDGQYLLAIPATYVMAEALVGAGVSPRARLLLRVLVACIALAALILAVAWEVSLIYFGVALGAAVYQTFQALTLATIVIIVLMLLAGSRKASHENRLRIRWVLWSTAYLIVCAAAMLMLEPVATRHPNLLEFVRTARWFAFAGYLYAAVRTRLIDVSFVVNRALVYAGITGLLFGIFSLLELGLHELAVGDKLSWALQAIAALLLAVALSPLHRRLEHWVERFFFRKQRLAIASVRSFAGECAFIEQESRLLETAVARLHPHCDAVAVYERTLSGYQRRASMGQAWPETLDVDDPAFVSLRAHRQEVDLHGLASAMGPESFAFPMVVGETLSGAVVCRPRAGERLAPDIRAALAEASRNLGAALYILRYREQARLVADIATGRIDETGARRRAIAMLEGTAA